VGFVASEQIPNDAVLVSLLQKGSDFQDFQFRTTGSKSVYGSTDCLWNLVSVNTITAADLTIIHVAEERRPPEDVKAAAPLLFTYS
jgi:hypothetical protein